MSQNRGPAVDPGQPRGGMPEHEPLQFQASRVGINNDSAARLPTGAELGGDQWTNEPVRRRWDGVDRKLKNTVHHL